MVRGSLVQTPTQVLQTGFRGLGEVSAFLLGNPTTRMLRIVQSWQRTAAPCTNPVELLWQLESLRAAGILTTEEFTEKKARLLARI